MLTHVCRPLFAALKRRGVFSPEDLELPIKDCVSIPYNAHLSDLITQ
jgi:hypothetical protein